MDIPPSAFGWLRTSVSRFGSVTLSLMVMVMGLGIQAAFANNCDPDPSLVDCLTAPTNVRASTSGSSVTLTWSYTPEMTPPEGRPVSIEAQIWANTKENPWGFARIPGSVANWGWDRTKNGENPPPQPSYTDAGRLQPGLKYQYRVCANYITTWSDGEIGSKQECSFPPVSVQLPGSPPPRPGDGGGGGMVGCDFTPVFVGVWPMSWSGVWYTMRVEWNDYSCNDARHPSRIIRRYGGVTHGKNDTNPEPFLLEQQWRQPSGPIDDSSVAPSWPNDQNTMYYKYQICNRFADDALPDQHCAWSRVVVMPHVPPHAPRILTTTVNSTGGVTITWEEDIPPEGGRYAVQALGSKGWEWVADSLDSRSTSWSDPHPRWGGVGHRSASYQICAIGDWQNPSARACATASVSQTSTFIPPPKVPTNVQARSIGGGHAQVSWESSDSSTTSFETERADGRGDFHIVNTMAATPSPSNSHFQLDDTLPTALKWTYRVCAVGGLGGRSCSAPVVIEPSKGLTLPH